MTPRLWLALVLIGGSLLFWSATSPDKFGFYHDDAIYVVTAKAFATGQGYRIVSLPDEPAQTKYPPLYPFLLSLVWRASPTYPDNVPALLALSSVAMVAFLWIAWLYLVNAGYASRGVALVAVAATALDWRTVVLATATLSEALYAALAAAVLWFAEAPNSTRPRRLRGIALGVGMGAVALTRTPGIALLAAVTVCCLFGKQPKSWLGPGIACAFVLSWSLWVVANRAPSDSLTAAYYTSYWRDWSASLHGASAGEGRLAALAGMIGTQAFRLAAVSLPVVCLGVDYGWHTRLPPALVAVGLLLLAATTALVVVGFVRQCRPALRQLHLYVLFYLGLHLVWPYSAHDRFLMPLLPFLIVFLVNGLTFAIAPGRAGDASLHGGLVSKARAGAFAAIGLAIVLFALWQHSSGLARILGPARRTHASQASEDAEIGRWIREHTGASEVLIGYRDPDTYLGTGRHMVRSSFVLGPQDPDGQASVLFRLIRESRARYLVRRSGDFDQDPNPQGQRERLAALVGRYPETFTPLFRSSSGGGVVYRIADSPQGHGR